MSGADQVGIQPGRGVYDADRAAALAGIPRSTLHYWARTRLYLPSIAAEPRVRLWSWADLLALRTIDWLRAAKPGDEPPKTSVRSIRQALQELELRGSSREELHALIAVLRGGQIVFEIGGETMLAGASGQTVMAGVLAPVRPYHGAPDLLEPRPRLRIIPGKLHGEPHLQGTRIATTTIFALAEAGYPLATIQSMYPEASSEALCEAIDFERSLRQPRAA